MTNGFIDFFEGALKLAGLQSEVDVPDSDPDFAVFGAVASEVNRLPIRNSFSGISSYN